MTGNLPVGNKLKPKMENIQQPADAAALCRDAATGRLPVQVVEHLHRLLGGDAHVEDMVLRFIADRYGAKNLFYLPPKAATEIIRRPADFIQAATNHCEPELKFL